MSDNRILETARHTTWDDGEGHVDYALVVIVPIRTVSEANRREHWAPKAKRQRAHRDACLMALRGETPPMLPCAVRLTRVAPRALDDDNLRGALKAVRDEVAEWMGLPNDRDPRVRWEYGQRRGKPGEYAVEVKALGTAPKQGQEGT